MAKESILKNRLKGFVYALKGAFLLLRTESSIQVQFILALVMTAAGFYFDISAVEWMLQTLAIGLVMGVEGVNTAVEKLSDYIQPNHDPKIGFVKDISAGGVMFVAIAAVIVGLIIYLPKIF
ncbi:MAG: diacylglycerol kinase family protein [Muriicola sp.]|nr:diacylglycerol kinase family protein [Muriicola sp.]MBT8283301.1 diacylglycerol kinase family protein [Muriicola sp.]NNK11102.1 diacylglycerol kinase family protein [Flavobacteriaceae bacterium]